jgi:amino acid transporter
VKDFRSSKIDNLSRLADASGSEDPTMTPFPGTPSSGGAASFLERALATLGRMAFGVLLFCAAMTALVATAFVGLMLALAAFFLGLSRSFRRRSRSETSFDASPQAGATFEARPTAEGWVIETGGSSRS